MSELETNDLGYTVFHFEHESDVKLLVILKGSEKLHSLYLMQDQWDKVSNLIRKLGEEALAKQNKMRYTVSGVPIVDGCEVDDK